MKQPCLRAVIFDLDGVLVDTSRFHAQAWAELVRSLGHEPPADIKERVRGISRMASLRVALGEHARSYTEEKLEEFATRKNEHYLELTKTLTPGDLYPGARRLLDDLKAKGIAVALGSASKNARMVLDSLEITDCFSAIVDGFSYKHGKPHPDIFLTAARSVDAKPEECIVVEDAAAGIISALDGGFVTVGIGEYDSLKHAHLYICGLEELDAGKLAELNERHNRTLWQVPFDEQTDIANEYFDTRCLVEGERVDFDTGTLERFEKRLDLRTGMFNVEARWTSPEGRTIEFSKRYFSDTQTCDRIFVQYQIEPLNFSGRVEIRAGVAAGKEDTVADAEAAGCEQNSEVAVLGLEVRDGQNPSFMCSTAFRAVGAARATAAAGGEGASIFTSLNCEAAKDELLLIEQVVDTVKDLPFSIEEWNDYVRERLLDTFSKVRIETAGWWSRMRGHSEEPDENLLEWRLENYRSIVSIPW